MRTYDIRTDIADFILINSEAFLAINAGLFFRFVQVSERTNERANEWMKWVCERCQRFDQILWCSDARMDRYAANEILNVDEVWHWMCILMRFQHEDHRFEIILIIGSQRWALHTNTAPPPLPSHSKRIKALFSAVPTLDIVPIDAPVCHIALSKFIHFDCK